MTLEELLSELEDDPFQTDMMDVDTLLRLAGYNYHEYPGTHLYRHPRWNSTYTFMEGWRTIPVSYLQRILREIRANLIKEGTSR